MASDPAQVARIVVDEMRHACIIAARPRLRSGFWFSGSVARVGHDLRPMRALDDDCGAAESAEI